MERIIDAASPLLDERRFNDVSVDDIINRADVSRSSFSARFDNKEALLSVLFDRYADRVRSEFAEALDVGAAAIPPRSVIEQLTVYSGSGMELRTVGGVQQFHMVGHLAEKSLGFPFNAYRPVLKIADLHGNAWNFLAGSSGTDIKIKCYAQDAGLTGVTRGIADAWLPLNPGGVNVAEPGFQVRVESVDFFTPTRCSFSAGTSARPTWPSRRSPTAVSFPTRSPWAPTTDSDPGPVCPGPARCN